MARTYDIILKDLCRDHHYYWTPDIRVRVKNYLNDWFKDVCSHSTTLGSPTPRCWWRSNKALVEDDELVVYFLPEPADSLVVKKAGADGHRGAAGRTSWTKRGMISEIYISKAAGDANLAKLLSILAFHELMHNKLDAHPEVASTVSDVHSMNGAGKANFGASDIPSDANKKAMGANLHLKVKQYTGHLFSRAVGGLPRGHM
jgi:hypothetical protein